jgi:hypothetical protein
LMLLAEREGLQFHQLLTIKAPKTEHFRYGRQLFVTTIVYHLNLARKARWLLDFALQMRPNSLLTMAYRRAAFRRFPSLAPASAA